MSAHSKLTLRKALEISNHPVTYEDMLRAYVECVYQGMKEGHMGAAKLFQDAVLTKDLDGTEEKAVVTIVLPKELDI